MIKKGCKRNNITAAVGPCIKQSNYNVKEDFKKRDLKEGAIVKATISEIGKKFIFVDLKAKSEGIIPIEEFKITKELEGLKVGSKVEVYLERIEGFKGEIVVSREKARRMSSWKRMEKAFKDEEEVSGKITSRTKAVSYTHLPLPTILLV